MPAALLAGCTPDYGALLRGKNLKLTIDKVEITADGTDKVTFTVMQDTRDITADCEIYLYSDNQTPIEGNVFTTTVPGEYSFYAQAYGKKSNGEKVTAKGTGLVITSSSQETTVGGSVTFTVNDGNGDVTSECKIHIVANGEDKELSGNTFTSEAIGMAAFYAVKGSTTSDALKVFTMDPDSNPDSYENFVHKSIGLQFTAQGCGPCANMKKAITILEEQSYEDAVIVACHTKLMPDTMYPDFWETLWNNYKNNMQGIPAICINLDPATTTGNLGAPEQTAENIKKTVSESMEAYPATSALSAIVYGDNGYSINTHAVVKFAQAGEYKVSAWLLEDGIMGYQQTMQGDINHHDVLRAKSHEDVLGEEISISAAGKHSFDFSFKASDMMNSDKPENSHVIVFVTKKNEAGAYILNNIIDCAYNATIPFAYGK